MRSLPRFFQCFIVSFFVSLTSGACFWHGIKYLTGRSPIGYLYKMTMYPDKYSLQYILVVCIVYSIVNSVWVIYIYPKSTRDRRTQIAAVITISLLVSGICGGMLWVIHDMKAGYIPSFSKSLDYIFWGGGQGLIVGPLIVFLSIPLNIFSLIAAYLCSKYLMRWSETWYSPKTESK